MILQNRQLNLSQVCVDLNIQPNLNYQLTKQRLSIFSPLSAFHPDSVSRRGNLITIRHALPIRFDRATVESDWIEMLSERLPEAEVVSVSVDRMSNLRARLFFENPIVRCAGGCGSLVEVPADPDESDLLCYECYLETYPTGGRKNLTHLPEGEGEVQP